MLKIEEIVFALFLVVAGAAGCALNNSTTFFLAMTVFLAAVIYLAKDLSRNVFILAFLVSFFTFLLGGETIMLLGLQENRYTFTAEADNHAYVAILISLVFLLLSYVAVNFLLPDRYGTTKSPESLPSNTPSIRRASLIFFYGTIVFKLIVNERLLRRLYGLRISGTGRLREAGDDEHCSILYLPGDIPLEKRVQTSGADLLICHNADDHQRKKK